jgi:hypothetical protein
MLCALPALRISQNRRKTNRIVGPNPSSRFCHQGALTSSGCALTTMPSFCSSAESSFSFAKAGISVLKRVVGFDFA